MLIDICGMCDIWIFAPRHSMCHLLYVSLVLGVCAEVLLNVTFHLGIQCLFAGVHVFLHLSGMHLFP